MAKRTKNAKAEIKIRLTEPLRAKIEKAAKARGVSMNAEMIEGLERTYREAADAGGPEIAALSRIFTAAFLIGGTRGAEARGHPEWQPEDWIKDLFAFRAATAAAFHLIKTYEPTRIEPKGSEHILQQWRAMDEYAAEVAGLFGARDAAEGKKP